MGKSFVTSNKPLMCFGSASAVLLNNGFLLYTKNLNPIGNALHVSFQKCLTLKEINNIKEFYLLSIADSQNPK